MPSAIKFSPKQILKLQEKVKAEQFLKEKLEMVKKTTYPGHLFIDNEAYKFEYILTKGEYLKLNEALIIGFIPKVVSWQFSRKNDSVWGELILKGKASVMYLQITMSIPIKIPDKKIIDAEWPWPHNNEKK